MSNLETAHDQFFIKCRGLIFNNDSILVVKHSSEDDYYALPGGHMDYNEDPVACMKREMEEELGIEAYVGKLLYINNFINKITNRHYIEFIFEIKNAKDYADLENIKAIQRSHDFEIDEIHWVNKDENINLRPDYIWEDFKNGDFDKDNMKDWQTRMKHSTRKEYEDRSE